MDAVCSGIVVYSGGDIVFGAKRSNQWMQYAVRSVQWNSGIWWWVSGYHVDTPITIKAEAIRKADSRPN